MTTKTLVREVLSWSGTLLGAVIVALLIRGFIFEPVVVDGHSMETTLHDKERLIMFKTGYLLGAPARGDIIVLTRFEGVLKLIPLPDPTATDYIKRVVALGGDTVVIGDGKVLVNGQETPWKGFGTTYADRSVHDIHQVKTYHVPEDSVFVMGDNREGSSDSREIGYIKKSSINGHATFRFYPFSRWGSLK